MPFSFDNPVGRLVQARLEETLTDEEIGRFRTKMWLTLSAVPGRAVLVGDLQRTVGFAPGVEEKLLAMLRVDNAKVERTAFILDGQSAFGPQVERLIAGAARDAEAAGKSVPDRRTFRDKRQAQAWLEEVLTPSERQSLATFLAAIG